MPASQFADEVDQEPDAHHQRREPERRELRHHREADRRDAQLARGVEQVGEHQPPHAGFLPPRPSWNVAATMNRKPMPVSTRPAAILRGVDGLRSRRVEPAPQRGEQRGRATR